LVPGQLPWHRSPVESADRGRRVWEHILGWADSVELAFQRSAEVVAGGLFHESLPVVLQPVLSRNDVVVRKDDESPPRLGQTRVSGPAETLDRLEYVSDRQPAGELRSDLPGVIRTVVVDNDELPTQGVRDFAAGDRLECDPETASVVPGT